MTDYIDHTVAWPLPDGAVATVVIKLPLKMGLPVIADLLPEKRVEYQGPSRGLGDTVAKATKAVGIRPCGGCHKRIDVLNKLVPYH